MGVTTIDNQSFKLNSLSAKFLSVLCVLFDRFHGFDRSITEHSANKTNKTLGDEEFIYIGRRGMFEQRDDRQVFTRNVCLKLLLSVVVTRTAGIVLPFHEFIQI